jgi:agmatinase
MTILAAICQRALVHGVRNCRAFSSSKLRASMPGSESDLRGDGAIRRLSPIGSTIEQTYAGALSFLRRNYTRNLINVDVAVTGIPLDLATTYRPGTRFGPKGIREASAQVARRKSYPEGIDLFADLAVIDYGDCWFDMGQPHTVPAAIEAHAKKIIDQNVFLLSLGKFLFKTMRNTQTRANIILGGDHYSTYPLLKAHVARHGKPLSLIQFDAHCDTWPDKNPHSLNHGSMFYYAVREGLIDPQTSIQVGIRTYNDDFMGVKILDADWVHRHTIENVVEEIKQRVGNNLTYLTFDIDCLDPAFAPGTGTPVCGGLTTAQAIAILFQLGSINYVGMDIVEVSPIYDQANITSLAAATIGYELLCLLRNKKIIDKSFPFGSYPKDK